MSKNIVKKFKNVIKDRRTGVTYHIYSNKQMNKKEMLQQIRFYHLGWLNSKPEPDIKVNIIAEEN